MNERRGITRIHRCIVVAVAWIFADFDLPRPAGCSRCSGSSSTWATRRPPSYAASGHTPPALATARAHLLRPHLLPTLRPQPHPKPVARSHRNLGSPLPLLRRDSAHRCHLHLHQDWAHPSPRLHRGSRDSPLPTSAPGLTGLTPRTKRLSWGSVERSIPFHLRGASPHGADVSSGAGRLRRSQS